MSQGVFYWYFIYSVCHKETFEDASISKSNEYMETGTFNIKKLKDMISFLLSETTYRREDKKIINQLFEAISIYAKIAKQLNERDNVDEVVICSY